MKICPPTKHADINRRVFVVGALGGVLAGCSSTGKTIEILSMETKQQLEAMIREAKVNYNGELHDFPNDAIIEGPDSDGFYRITSEKLQKVTADTFRFNSNLELVTENITIQIDPFDIFTQIVMERKFGLKTGDICSVIYREGILFITKG